MSELEVAEGFDPKEAGLEEIQSEETDTEASLKTYEILTYPAESRGPPDPGNAEDCRTD